MLQVWLTKSECVRMREKEVDYWDAAASQNNKTFHHTSKYQPSWREGWNKYITISFSLYYMLNMIQN